MKQPQKAARAFLKYFPLLVNFIRHVHNYEVQHNVTKTDLV